MPKSSELRQAVYSTPDGESVGVQLKVVPGASRTKLAGLLGDRLKVAVAAPPEGGKANRAVCELLAEVFGVAERNVTIIAGPAQPRKTALVTGITLAMATQRLRAALGG